MVFGAIGALAGAGGSALGAIGGRESAKDTRRDVEQRFQRGRKFIGDASRATEASNQEQLGYLYQMRDDASATRSRVMQYVDDGFRNEAARIYRERDQRAARVRQDAISRGLMGSTATISAERGVNADADYALGQTSVGFTNARANADVTTSNNYQASLGTIAQTLRVQRGDLNNLALQLANAHFQEPVVQVPNWMEVGSQVLGGAIGGYGLGAAAGKDDALSRALGELF